MRGILVGFRPFAAMTIRHGRRWQYVLPVLLILAISGCNIGSLERVSDSATDSPAQPTEVPDPAHRDQDPSEKDPTETAVPAPRSGPADLSHVEMTHVPGPDIALLEQRPLDLPRISDLDPCPRSDRHQPVDAFGIATGDGPVYPLLGGLNESESDSGAYQYPPEIGRNRDEPAAITVLWIAAPEVDGAVIVRGEQIDEENELLFTLGDDPLHGIDPRSTLPLENGGYAVDAPGWHHWTTATLLPGPGCFAYQIDGLEFSTVAVFEVLP